MTNNKYVIYIDYCAGGKESWDYIKCDTMSLPLVLSQAEEIYRKNGGSDNIYLIRIMEHFGKARKSPDGTIINAFKAILCKRSEKGGWHLNDESNHENEHIAHWCRKVDVEWCEVA